MWAERMRQDWQHTSFLAAYLIEVNKAKKGKQITPDQLNPMETGRRGPGIPLGSQEGFHALQSIAKSWRKP